MNIAGSNRKILAAMIAAIVCVGAIAPTFAQDQQDAQTKKELKQQQAEKKEDEAQA